MRQALQQREAMSIKRQTNRESLQIEIDTKIAISMLSTSESNFATVANLKSFLSTSSQSIDFNRILGPTILHFAEKNYSIFSWILENQNLLLPEFNLLSFTKNLIVSRLSDQGSSLEGFNRFYWDRTLFADRTSLAKFTNHFSEPEIALIKTVFKFDL